MLTTPPELMARLINRIVGDLPGCGCLSTVTLTVAVHACPALATAGFPVSAMFRSLASAAGTKTTAASAVKTISLRMLFLLRSQVLHRSDRSGSAGGRIGAPRQHAHPSSTQLERDRRGVVRVGA